MFVSSSLVVSPDSGVYCPFSTRNLKRFSFVLRKNNV